MPILGSVFLGHSHLLVDIAGSRLLDSSTLESIPANSGCTFQRLMDQICQGLPYCFVYVDDVLISSPDLVSHLEHVRRILDLLRLHGLSINPDKCVFAAPTVDYLGMRVSGSGCVPLVKHTEIISAFPTDKKGLQRFLGILNFYRRFIKGACLPLASSNWSSQG